MEQQEHVEKPDRSLSYKTYHKVNWLVILVIILVFLLMGGMFFMLKKEKEPQVEMFKEKEPQVERFRSTSVSPENTIQSEFFNDEEI